MSIDDDYFDLEDAIEKGELGDYGDAVGRILQALTDQEKLTMALQDRVVQVEESSKGILWDKAEAAHEIKTLKRRLERLSA